MGRNAPTQYDDVIDSRDIIERIELLQDLDDRDEEEQEELRALEALAADASGSPDWQHGETLIRDSYFKEYAQELAEECGMLAGATSWPLTCIDWDHAAKELQYDYTAVEFAGVSYWIRS